MKIRKEIDLKLKETEITIRTWSDEEYQKLLNKLDQRIPFNTTEGLILINPSELFYIEAVGNYVELHSLNQSFLVRSPLYKISDLLQHYFIQVSRSYLINFEQLSSIENDFIHGLVARVGKYKIPISRSGLKAINNRISEEENEKIY